MSTVLDDFVWGAVTSQPETPEVTPPENLLPSEQFKQSIKKSAADFVKKENEIIDRITKHESGSKMKLAEHLTQLQQLYAKAGREGKFKGVYNSRVQPVVKFSLRRAYRYINTYKNFKNETYDRFEWTALVRLAQTRKRFPKAFGNALDAAAKLPDGGRITTKQADDFIAAEQNRLAPVVKKTPIVGTRPAVAPAATPAATAARSAALPEPAIIPVFVEPDFDAEDREMAFDAETEAAANAQKSGREIKRQIILADAMLSVTYTGPKHLMLEQVKKALPDLLEWATDIANE